MLISNYSVRTYYSSNGAARTIAKSFSVLVFRQSKLFWPIDARNCGIVNSDKKGSKIGAMRICHFPTSEDLAFFHAQLRGCQEYFIISRLALVNFES